MSWAEDRSTLSSRLSARVEKPQPEYTELRLVLLALERLGAGAMSWDGTAAGLFKLAARIRQTLDYNAIAIALSDAGTLSCRAIDPPDIEIVMRLSAQDLTLIPWDDQPFLAPDAADTLIVPLVADAQRIGLIEIALDSQRIPSAIKLWRVLGPQITSIITGGQLRTEMRRARQREQLLRDVSSYLALSSDLDARLVHVLNLVIPFVGGDDGSLLMLDDRQQVVTHIPWRSQFSSEQDQPTALNNANHKLAEWIIRSRQAAIIPDTLTDDRCVWFAGDGEKIRSLIGVPLQRGEGICGLFFVVHHEPGHFGREHLSFLSAVSDLVAITVENAFLAEQVRRRTKEVDLINEVSHAASSLHLDDVLRTVTRKIVQSLQVRRCAVFLLDDIKKQVVLRAVHNAAVENDYMDVVVSLEDHPHVALAIDKRAPIEVKDVFADDRLRSFWVQAREWGIRSQIAVPLISRQRVIGAISIDCAESSPTSGESIDLLAAIARQVASAIENARLYGEIKRRAERLWLANTVSHDLGTQLDIHQLLWEAVRLVRETFDCYYVAVGLIEGDELVFRAGINHLYQTIPRLRLPLHTQAPSIAGLVAQQGRPCLVRDVREDPRYRMRPGLGDARSQLTVPLKALERAKGAVRATDHTIGVLDVSSTEVGAFGDEDQRLLEALAAQVSVAIENARLFSRVQEEQATLEAIINGTSDAIIVTDTADRVLFFNPAAQAAFRNGEMLQPGSLLPETVNNRALWTFWQQAAQNDGQSAEIPLPDGRTLHASITTVGDVGKVAVMQDITYLKELDQIKSEFVSTVSHDLRSPLQVIQSSAELIPRMGEVNQEQRRQVEHILAIVRRISDLVNNLLDIGRIEAGVGMDVEPCAIDEVIARAAGACRTLAQERGIEFVIDLPRTLPLVKGNPLRLDQVITNLVVNAIKFTPEGSVTVVARKDGDRVIFEVRDTGIGIPLDAQENLFEKFYRVKSPETRGIQGTGLGLAIAKSIVESYGGKIEVESFPRLGSIFTVNLPVYAEALPIA